MDYVRPLECERTRHFLSVRLDAELSQFERALVVAHVARCEPCRSFETRIDGGHRGGSLGAARAARPAGAASEPAERRAGGRSARVASVGALRPSVAVVAFVGFAAAPDRSTWQDDSALIASALDRPAGTNDLLIDVVRPTLASRRTGRSRSASRRHRGVQAAPRARRLARPLAGCDRPSRSLPSGRDCLGRGRCGGAARRGRRDRRPPAREHRDGRPRQERGDPARPERARVRRPRALRGRARHREDGPRARDRPVDRRSGPVARPVHARPAADRRHRALDLQPEAPRVRVPAGPDLRQRRPRRRDQPRDAEDAGGAARGDGRAAGDDRRADPRSCRARSCSSRRRTRSSTRARSRSPRRSSTGSS